MPFALPALPESPSGAKSSRFDAICCAHLAVFACVFYFWTAAQAPRPWVSKVPNDYYGLLTAGFQSGHLYVPIAPHPLLLALPNPYDPVANAPYRVHDMSLYRGHYYLYYGVTPALILFWPVAAVSGYYVSEPFAVALFCSGAVCFGIALLLAARQRYFPSASSLALVAGAAGIAFATPLMLLVQAAEFYQVAISCAILMQTLMIGALYLSIKSPQKGAYWLAVAGLFFGLSMGARPNYILEIAALSLPVAAAARAVGMDVTARKKLVRRLSAFTFTPVAVCAIGLMSYNKLRFGSFTEFGLQYMLAGASQQGYQALSVGSLLPNLYAYLLAPGTWQSYFPFFGAVAGQPFGLVRYLPWTWLAFLPLASLRIGVRMGMKDMGLFVRVLAWAAFGNLAFLSVFNGVNARYAGDFACAGLELAGIGAMFLSTRFSSGWAGYLARSGLFVGAGVSIFLSFCVYFGTFPVKDSFLAAARVLNSPGYYWQRSHGGKFGGLRVKAILPSDPGELPEPLLETGIESDRRDWFQIDYPSPGMARLGLFHAGTGVLEGDEFPIPPDRHIDVEVNCGSLIPPFGHPVFANWTRTEFDEAKRDLEVKVNRMVVLQASYECYDSTPANLRLGRVGWPTGIVAPRFSGKIISVDRLPLTKPEKVVPVIGAPSPVELSLYLPTLRQNGADPLLATGSGINSDLLYCVYDGQRRVRFALDHYGAGGPQSEPIAFDPRKPHELSVCMGPLSAAPALNRLVVVFDGRALLNVKQDFFPGTPETAEIGFNAYGSSAAGQQFTGRILKIKQVSIASLPPPLKASGEYGAVEMSVRLPYEMVGQTEPLVVTGKTGAGDFVYASYIDARHIVLGFDHWAYGGHKSDPIEIDYGQVHRISVTMDSLYAGGGPLKWKGIVQVSLDGEVVLDEDAKCYPSSGDEIRIGDNTIGGSTCGPVFSGQILSIERFSTPRE